MNKNCAFYELQNKLRTRGWYVEWTFSSQENHVWEDIPSHHEIGPFCGKEIDLGKVLVSYIGDSDSNEVPEGLSYEEVFDWHEVVVDFLSSGDEKGLNNFFKKNSHPDLRLPTPEGWGGNEFLCPWEEGMYDEVIPLAESCGCRCTAGFGGLWIEWGDSNDRWYPKNKSGPLCEDPKDAVNPNEGEHYFSDLGWIPCDQSPAEWASGEQLLVLAKSKWPDQYLPVSRYENPRVVKALRVLVKRCVSGDRMNSRMEVVQNLLNNPVSDASVLRGLVKCENPDIRCKIMDHLNCNLSIWHLFVDDNNGFVREYAAKHPNCPVKVLKLLTNDSLKKVSNAAQKNLKARL